MSNLLKQCFVVNTEGNRIINSDRSMQERLKKEEMGQYAPQTEETDSDAQVKQGSLPTFEEEKEKLEQFRKEMIAGAQTMANQITSTAQSKANGILDAAKLSAQQLFEEQKQFGYEEGKKQSEQELATAKAQLQQEYDQNEQRLQLDYKERMEHMECDIVDAVVQVMEKVFQVQFSDERTILLALVKNTLMDVDAGNKVRIHVNEADHQMLMEHMDEIQKQLGQDVSIEFAQENKFEDGQCQIETSYGVFDCGIDTQFKNLVKDIRLLV